jgi:hypothetical protein
MDSTVTTLEGGERCEHVDGQHIHEAGGGEGCGHRQMTNVVIRLEG